MDFRSSIVLTLLCFLMLSSSVSLSQRGTGFQYAGWSGGAFELLEKAKQKGYFPQAFNGAYLETIRFDSIYIPKQSSQQLFGLTNLSGSWCTELFSTLEISEAGCYEIDLSSDDGSKLWLDSLLIVDNDGLHKWKQQLDTVFLALGNYQAQLWYYSGLSPSCGLTLAQRLLPDEIQCRSLKPNPKPKAITLNANTLFESGAHILLPTATTELDALCDSLGSLPIKRLTLIGHTDSIGRAYPNLLLSRRRAGSVLSQLRKCLSLDDAEIEVDGFGESQPIQSNASPVGRAANRRVEIFIE